MLSFDVVNLFSSIPASECLNILSNLLSFSDTPDYLASSLLELTRVTLEQDFFLFNNKFSKQTSGLAMGSSISLFLAEVFMNLWKPQ